MKGKRNLLKIIFFASTFFLATNTSSVYSETLREKCNRIGKGYDWNSCGIKLTKDGDLWGAAAAYGKSIMEDPYSAIPHYNLGIVKNKLGDIEGAIDSYTRALFLDPMYGSAYNNRGRIYIKKGNKSAACDDFLQGKYNGNKGSFTNYSNFCETSKKDSPINNKNSILIHRLGTAFLKKRDAIKWGRKNCRYPKMGMMTFIDREQYIGEQLWIPCIKERKQLLM